MREFDTGATRDDDDDKLDFEGFLSPVALEEYARYLHKHRQQADGQMRASDNWQNGIANDVYMKSAFRHFMDWWKSHRGYDVYDTKDGHHVHEGEAICALIFNAFGYLHELLVRGYTETSEQKVLRRKTRTTEEAHSANILAACDTCASAGPCNECIQEESR